MEKTNENLKPRVRSLLQTELSRLMDSNPKYSLRAFAKKLEIDASSLSKFLRGKRDFSDDKLVSILFRLGVSEEQKKIIFESCGNELQILEFEQYQILSTWYYTSILEMTDLDHFKPAPKWIAEQLRIPVTQVQIAVDKLMQAGALKVDEEGNWVNCWERFTTVTSINTDELALRDYQKQIKQRAMDSIDKDQAHQKDHTSYELAIDSDLFELAKEEIKIFRRGLAKKLEQESKKKDCVVNLNISFFSQTVL